MKWVLSTDDLYYRWYWDGQISDYGYPGKTRERKDAKEFDTAQDANDRAKWEPKLQSWRARRL